MLKRLMSRRFAVGIMALLVLLIVALVFVLAQEAQWDSTKMKLLWERVKVEITTDEEHEYLQQIGFDCPERGEFEVILNRWQTKQLAKRGFKVIRLQRLSSDEGPNQVEYEQVSEVDLQEKEVQAVYFDTKDISHTGGTAIFKVDELVIYDVNPSNSETKPCRGKPALVSSNLDYIGIFEVLEVPENKEMWEGKERFSLLGKGVESLWSIEYHTYWDYPKDWRPIAVSDQGTVLAQDNRSLIFYNKRGEPIKEIPVVPATWMNEKRFEGVFSRNGNYLVIITDTDVNSIKTDGSVVILFDASGDELWRFTIAGGTPGYVSISGDGSYVVASILGKGTYLLDNTGNLIKAYRDINSTEICLSTSSKYVLLVDGNRKLVLIDREKGDIVLEYSVMGRPRLVYSVDIAEEAQVVGLISQYAALSKPPFTVESKEKNVELLLIDFNGRKFWSKTFPFPSGGAKLVISDDAKEIKVRIGSKIMIYRQAE